MAAQRKSTEKRKEWISDSQGRRAHSVFMHTHIYAHINACNHAHTCTYTHTQTHAMTYTQTHTYIHTDTHTNYKIRLARCKQSHTAINKQRVFIMAHIFAIVREPELNSSWHLTLTHPSIKELLAINIMIIMTMTIIILLLLW